MDDALIRSVTRDDHTDDAGRKNSYMPMWVQSYGTPHGMALPPAPPPYWSFRRDDVLRSTVLFESGWASAIYIAATKLSSLSWNIKGLGLKARKSRDLLMEADGGQGWVPFISKQIRDFLTTDNGSFIEVVRSSSYEGSRIIGLFHLDSRRCTRTGDPDIPVIYRDRKNVEHELKDYQVLCFSDLPDPGEMWYGVGYCAASRAYNAIYRTYAMENYVTEKTTGRRATALHFINNVNQQSIQDATVTAEAEANSKGYVSYLGAIIIPNIDPNSAPQVATIDLVGLPEGFNAEQERRNAYLLYANAIGLDPQEIDPQLLASRALGTGAQARVIDDKASGKGLVAWRQAFTHMLNECVVPESVSFSFTERDYRDQMQQAELNDKRATTLQTLIGNGVISPEQALNLLVDVDQLPAVFLAQDETPVEAVGDADNPEEAEGLTGATQQFDEYGQPIQSDPTPAMATDAQGNPLPTQLDETGNPIPAEVALPEEDEEGFPSKPKVKKPGVQAKEFRPIDYHRAAEFLRHLNNGRTK